MKFAVFELNFFNFRILILWKNSPAKILQISTILTTFSSAERAETMYVKQKPNYGAEFARTASADCIG